MSVISIIERLNILIFHFFTVFFHRGIFEYFILLCRTRTFNCTRFHREKFLSKERPLFSNETGPNQALEEIDKFDLKRLQHYKHSVVI